MNEITFAFTDDWLYEDETIHPKHISKVILRKLDVDYGENYNSNIINGKKPSITIKV